MSKFKFQGVLYATCGDMQDAIVETWLSADGAYNTEEQARFLRGTTDDQLAADCVAAWGLDQAEDGREAQAESHMNSCGYSQSDLTSAFGRLRERISIMR